MNTTINRQSLDSEIGLIQHEGIRTLVQNVLEACPTCFWTMPASSTGKHHPAHSLGQGGLVRHTKAVVQLALHLLHMRGILPGTTAHDTVIAAAILHDCCKKADGEQHTAFDHPQRAADLIWQHATLLACAGEDEARDTAARAICSMVSTHMGRWCTSTHHRGITLPMPITWQEYLLHTADYLASRKDILVTLEPQSGGSGTLEGIS